MNRPLLHQAQESFARTVLEMPRPLLERVLRRPVVRDGLRLDPQVQLFLWTVEKSRRPRLCELSVASARKAFEDFARVFPIDAPRAARQVDTTVEGAAGAIPMRIVYPRGLPERAPVLLYVHGGGFVIGDIETHDPVCRALASRAGCAVASIDYRRAPEHPFPAAVEDTLTAYRALHGRAEELGLDPDRMAIGGESAGGCLSAVVAQLLRDEDEPEPLLQLLIYPMADANHTAESIETFAEDFFLDRDTIFWFRDHYLGDHSRNDFRASPLKRPSLSGVAPASVITAGFDPLRDEGQAYADKLAAAGVPTRHRRADGQIHGFLQMGFLEALPSLLDRMAGDLRDAFAGRFHA